MTPKSDLPQLRIRLETDVVSLIDSEVEAGTFRSRQEAVNEAIVSYFVTGKRSDSTILRDAETSISYMLWAFLMLNKKAFPADHCELLWEAAEKLDEKGFVKPYGLLKSAGLPPRQTQSDN